MCFSIFSFREPVATNSPSCQTRQTTSRSSSGVRPVWVRRLRHAAAFWGFRRLKSSTSIKFPPQSGHKVGIYIIIHHFFLIAKKNRKKYGIFVHFTGMVGLFPSGGRFPRGFNAFLFGLLTPTESVGNDAHIVPQMTPQLSGFAQNGAAFRILLRDDVGILPYKWLHPIRT